MTRQAEAGRLLDVSDYELRHLAAHLEAAGRAVDLHRLLGMETPDAGGGNLWFRARSATSDDVGYADDLERAWRIARVASMASNREATEARSLEARYALMVASLASQAAGIPPGLVTRLLETAIWTTEQAIAAAERMPDLERRTEALAAIAEQTTLDAETRERVLGAALQAARQLTDVYRQSRTLAALALKLPAPMLSLAYQLPSPTPKVLELRYSTGVAAHGNTRGSPAPISPADAERLLADAESLESEPDRVERLAAAIPYLTSSTIGRAREIAAGLSGELQRTFALARLVPRLVELDQIDEAREALTRLASTRSLEEGVTRLMAGAADARHPITDSFWAAETTSRDVSEGAPDEAARLERALHDARRIGDSDSCDAVVRAGATLAGQIGATDAAIALTRNVQLPQARCEAIASLAPSIPTGDDRLVDVARQVDDPYWRSVAVLGVLPQLDGAQKEQAAEAIEQIALSWSEHGFSGGQAADILARVAPYLAGREQVRSCQRALDIARSAGDDVRALILVIGLSIGPDQWIRIAESETDSLADESVRGFVLAALAAALAAHEHGGSTHQLELASSIVDPYWRNAAIASVARTLARQGQGSGALGALRSLDPSFVTPSVAAAVAGVLDDGDGRQLIELLARGDEPGRRARSLASIALVARGIWRQDAIRSAVASAAMTGDETERSVALVLLAQLERSSLTEGLEPLAATLRDTVARAVAEIGLLLAAAEPEVSAETALQQFGELESDVAAAAALRLAAAVPAWQHPLAAVMAASIDGVTDPEVRLDLMRAIGAASTTVDSITLARYWTDALVREAPAGRAWLLRVLAELLPVAVRLGDVDLLVAVPTRVDEVRRWWP